MADLLPAFAAAVLQRPGKVLGRRLVPYTLGHELLLVRVGSPFIVGGAPDLGALLQALEILWRPWREGEAMLREDAALAKRIARTGWLVVKLLGPDWVNLACLRLADYLRRARGFPPMSNVKANGEPTEMPLLQLVLLVLVQHGFTREEVWAMPYREALWHYVAISELDGGNLRLGDQAANMQEAAKELLPGWSLIREEDVKKSPPPL